MTLCLASSFRRLHLVPEIFSMVDCSLLFIELEIGCTDILLFSFDQLWTGFY